MERSEIRRSSRMSKIPDCASLHPGYTTNKNGRARARPFDSVDMSASVQREILRIAANILRRAQRLAIDRAVEIFAREGRIAYRRREGVVGELAVARIYLGAAAEPGALAHIDAGAALLIARIGAARAVIVTAAVIALLLGVGRGGGCGGSGTCND